jgi:hypothetical protein
MPQNMSFASNGVDQVRSLRKIPTQLHLANLSVNSASSASFGSSFVKLWNGPKHASFWSNGVDRVRSFRKDPTQPRLANLCYNGANSASFASKNFDATSVSELVR